MFKSYKNLGTQGAFSLTTELGPPEKIIPFIFLSENFNFDNF